MFAKQKTIMIDASPEAVYDYVSDISRHSEWAKHPLVIQKLGDGRFASSTEVLHLEPKSVLEVETTDRPRRFSFISNDSIAGRYRWYFDISPAGTGSKVNYGLERLAAPLAVKLLQPWLMWPVDGRGGVVTGLANIKRNLEAQTTSAAAPARTTEAQGR
jgi:Polyketide cyclase / dehydrase and lipid transport